ncbi:hypothetical protein Y032_0232g3049 [Ancylostoma ceylanicum]|uniref:Uncharacterized protein n=1 Tax=Ancylostoma ceylanicum TaxID=53326 RepID=A0A016SGK5_9BILA|nr:hypothetical protein Y032_0232g3049 [Ancylostoma ceylanicum]
MVEQFIHFDLTFRRCRLLQRSHWANSGGGAYPPFDIFIPGCVVSEHNLTHRKSSSSTFYKIETAFQVLPAGEYMVLKPCNLEQQGVFTGFSHPVLHCWQYMKRSFYSVGSG